MPRMSMGVLLLAAGCNNPTYLFQSRPLETQLMAMGGFQADTDLYVLPVHTPTAQESVVLLEEQAQLGLAQPLPWVGLRDFDIAIHYTLKNLDGSRTQATFSVNGGNEFGDYVPTSYLDPAVDANDQEPPPPLWTTPPLELGPNEVRSGVVREDELAEAALDLEAITRFPAGGDVLATPYQVLLRHSSASRVGLEDIPPGDVTPALVRLQLNLSATGHVVLDYSVRVRDHAKKLARPTDLDLYVSTAPTLAPPVAPPAP